MNFQPTNFPIENELPKLIRDKIPEIIKNRTGSYPETMIADEHEFFKYLLKKVVEEAIELQNSEAQNNTQEELADLMELIDTILKFKNWDLEDIRLIQNQKRENNGGFETRTILLK